MTRSSFRGVGSLPPRPVSSPGRLRQGAPSPGPAIPRNIPAVAAGAPRPRRRGARASSQVRRHVYRLDDQAPLRFAKFPHETRRVVGAVRLALRGARRAADRRADALTGRAGPDSAARRPSLGHGLRRPDAPHAPVHRDVRVPFGGRRAQQAPRVRGGEAALASHMRSRHHGRGVGVVGQRDDAVVGDVGALRPRRLSFVRDRVFYFSPYKVVLFEIGSRPGCAGADHPRGSRGVAATRPQARTNPAAKSAALVICSAHAARCPHWQHRSP